MKQPSIELLCWWYLSSLTPPLFFRYWAVLALFVNIGFGLAYARHSYLISQKRKQKYVTDLIDKENQK